MSKQKRRLIMNPATRKNITPWISALLLMLVLVGFAVPLMSNAAEPVGDTRNKSFLENFAAGAFLPVAVAVQGVLFIIRAVLMLLLGFASSMLNAALGINLGAVPSQMNAVLIGWGMMRDVANSLYILIVLWIALTIIFDIESLGGRKFLVRVIFSAVLINFSLAFVTVVFSFSNQVSLAFANKIKVNEGDVAGFIISATRFQEVLQTLDKEGLQRLKQEQQKKVEDAKAAALLEEISGTNSIKSSVLAAFGVRPAQASVLGLGGCGIGALVGLVGGPVGLIGGCIGGAIAGAIIDGLIGFSASITDVVVKSAVNMAIGIVFIAMLVFVFIWASLGLIMRLIAMIFISIFAPAAFFALAIPGNYGKKYWDLWVSKLLYYAFYAPAFYFLLYLTLLMAKRFSESLAGATASQWTANAERMVQFAVLLVFLIAIGRYSKDAAGKLGAFTVDLGKKVGGLAIGAAAAYATGGAALLAGKVASRALAPDTRVSKGIAGLAESPILGKLGGARVQRAAARYVQSKQEDITQRAKALEPLSKDQSFRDYHARVSAEEKVAHLKRFAEKGWLGDFEQQYGTDSLKRGLQLASRFGMAGPLLRANPELATADLLSEQDRGKLAATTHQDPVRYVTENLKTAELNELNPTAMNSAAVREGLVHNPNFSKNQLEKAAEKNVVGARMFVEELERAVDQLNQDLLAAQANPQQHAAIQTELNQLERNFKGYLATTAAQGLGFRMPKQWLEPIKLTGNLQQGNPGGAYNIDTSSQLTGGRGRYAVEPNSIEIDGIPAGVAHGLNIDTAGNITGTISNAIPAGTYNLKYKVRNETRLGDPPDPLQIVSRSLVIR